MEREIVPMTKTYNTPDFDSCELISAIISCISDTVDLLDVLTQDSRLLEYFQDIKIIKLHLCQSINYLKYIRETSCR